MYKYTTIAHTEFRYVKTQPNSFFVNCETINPEKIPLKRCHLLRKKMYLCIQNMLLVHLSLYCPLSRSIAISMKEKCLIKGKLRE